MEKKDFRNRLILLQEKRKAREARAEEQIYNNYTVENCVKSVESRRRYLNGKRYC